MAKGAKVDAWLRPFTEEPLRTLDDEGNYHGPEDRFGLTDEDLLRIYELLVYTRAFDERAWTLVRQGKIYFYAASAGQEAAQVASVLTVGPEDWVYIAHRELGVALARGYPMDQLMAQLFGTMLDPNKGRQMPNHWGHRAVNMPTISSVVGTQIIHAVGIAWALRYQGKDAVVLTYFGDGGASENDFHTGLNFAGVYRTPTVFFCQNNGWAISVPTQRQTASKNIAVKAVAYGFDGYYVDGNDPIAVYGVTKHAVERARAGEGPTLIEALTYRYSSHSSADDAKRYRPEDEVQDWQEKRDPIRRTRLYLEKLGLWDQEREMALWERARQEVEAAVQKAEAAPRPPVESLFEDVYAEIPWHLQAQREALLNELNERGGGR